MIELADKWTNIQVWQMHVFGPSQIFQVLLCSNIIPNYNELGKEGNQRWLPAAGGWAATAAVLCDPYLDE